MTQYEHLKRIRARCVELLALAEKRTQGEWEAEGCTVWSHDSERESSSICDTLSHAHDSDALFIASCAGPAEAGWKATIAAIDDIFARKHFDGGVFPSCTLTTAILAAWPEELL